MGELKRILGAKKHVLCIVLLFFANFALFQYSQIETLRTLREPESSLRELWKEEREEAREQYYERARGMSDRADSMLQISIFADEDSFSYKNIKKTIHDFQPIADVKIGMEEDRAVVAFLDYREQHYIAFAIVLMFVLALFDERKSGLWQIVYSCPKGRFCLAVKRMLLLLVLSVITAVVLALSTLVLSFWDYGGMEILNAPAQSVISLQNFTMDIPVSAFLVYYILIGAAALFVEGMFVWGMLSGIHNRNMATVVLVAVYGVECAVYHLLIQQNPLCLAKYLNLFFWLDVTPAFTEYINFAFGNVPVNLREFINIILPVSAVLFMGWVLWVCAVTRPFYVSGVLERWTERLFCRIRRGLCLLRGTGYEWYKYMVQGRGFIILAVFFYILYSTSQPVDVLLSPDRELLDDFYTVHTGEMNGSAKEEYDRIRDELKAIQKKLEIVSRQEGTQNFDRDSVQEEYESYETDRKMFRMLKKQYNYGKKLEERGIKGWFINERGFEKLLGEKGTAGRIVSGELVVLVLIFLLAPCFASEWQSGIGNILCCTKKGRGPLFFRKYLCAGILVLVVTAALFISEIYVTVSNYPLRGWMAPVQNIPVLERFPFSWNILTFFFAWYAMRIAVFGACAILCLWVSVLFSRVEKAYLYSLPVLAPGLLSEVSGYMVFGTGRIVKTLTVLFVVGVLSVFGVVCAWKRFCTARRHSY